ncbi:GNAT family N-acetyltransferase [Streptomyces pacificus]|uniref:GNAT family N-acetyltransferase n=1 Tax=Streptomyces pacificus TaxID=2705029 RepID=A0A6A0AXW6_9ACTN|nr:GNAT family N-acetyltransferase [Streptomyces pacificus]GFH37275.1 GNAT family N-acetyltransferase [Streptomyces pacificus]
METKTRIRRYEASDEAVVVDLWSRASKLAHPFIEGEGEGERARKLREVYLRVAENWVAEVDGEVVALLGLLEDEIGGLFVDPRAQGRGVGRELVRHAAALRGGGLRLEVFEANARARGFYERMGFTERERRQDEDSGHRLILMVRPPGPGLAAPAR